MRRFRFSSWRFKLVMFVLITICFYDLGYYEPENKEIPIKEIINSPGTPAEEEIEVIDVP